MELNFREPSQRPGELLGSIWGSHTPHTLEFGLEPLYVPWNVCQDMFIVFTSKAKRSPSSLEAVWCLKYTPALLSNTTDLNPLCLVMVSVRCWPAKEQTQVVQSFCSAASSEYSLKVQNTCDCFLKIISLQLQKLQYMLESIILRKILSNLERDSHCVISCIFSCRWNNVQRKTKSHKSLLEPSWQWLPGNKISIDRENAPGNSSFAAYFIY